MLGITNHFYLYRQSSRLTHVTFDGEPTADSELHNKLDRAVRDELEALVSSVALWVLASTVFSDFLVCTL